MSRARDLSKLGNPNVIVADTEKVGFGTQVPENPANAASSLISAGIVTAAQFFGDGSNLEGVASAGLGTAVDDTKDSIGQNIYFTNAELSINANTTVNAPDSSNIAYTQYQQVTVESGSELIIADGDSFIPDVLGIGTALQASTAGAGNGLFGTIFVDNIENVAGRGGPNFPLGITVAGVSTLSGNVSIGGTLTYEDVTNVDSVGVVTARSGVDINAGGLDITAGGANIVGVSTLGGNLNINGPDNNNTITLKNTTASDASNSRSSKIIFQGTRSGGEVSDLVHLAGQHDGGNDNDWGAFRVLVNNGSGVTERFGVGQGGEIRINASIGSAGQVLTSQGGGSAPQWTTPSGGLTEVIASAEIGQGDYGSRQIDLVGITTTYSQAKLVVTGLNFNQMVSQNLWIQFMVDGSSTPVTSSVYDYSTNRLSWPGGNSNNLNYSNGKSQWELSLDGSYRHWNFELIIPIINSNVSLNNYQNIAYMNYLMNPDGGYWGREVCRCNSGSATRITGVRLFSPSGNNFGYSGRIVLYGLKYS